MLQKGSRLTLLTALTEGRPVEAADVNPEVVDVAEDDAEEADEADEEDDNGGGVTENKWSA